MNLIAEDYSIYYNYRITVQTQSYHTSNYTAINIFDNNHHAKFLLHLEQKNKALCKITESFLQSYFFTT